MVDDARLPSLSDPGEAREVDVVERELPVRAAPRDDRGDVRASHLVVVLTYDGAGQQPVPLDRVGRRPDRRQAVGALTYPRDRPRAQGARDEVVVDAGCDHVLAQHDPELVCEGLDHTRTVPNPAAGRQRRIAICGEPGRRPLGPGR